MHSMWRCSWIILSLGLAVSHSAMAEEPVGKPKPLSNPSEWIRDTDYPTGEYARAVQGVTAVSLIVSEKGEVMNCRVDASSGSIALDSTACALLKARALFEPARDANRRKVASEYSTRIVWRLPKNASYALPVGKQSVTAMVDIDEKGKVEKCSVTDGADFNEARSACLRFPTGQMTRIYTDISGKPVKFRLLMTQTIEVQPR